MSRITGLWWWIDRWRKSSAFTGMTLEQQGAYRNLLDEATLRGGAIPNDENTLARACGDARRWKRVRDTVLRHFDLKPDGWHNETLDAVLAKGAELFEQRSASGKAGNKARWGIANGIANASQNLSQTPSQNDRKAVAKPIAPDPYKDLNTKKTGAVAPACIPEVTKKNGNGHARSTADNVSSPLCDGVGGTPPRSVDVGRRMEGPREGSTGQAGLGLPTGPGDVDTGAERIELRVPEAARTQADSGNQGTAAAETSPPGTAQRGSAVARPSSQRERAHTEATDREPPALIQARCAITKAWSSR